MSLGWLFCDTCQVYRKWPELSIIPKDYDFPLECEHSSNINNDKCRFETDDSFEEAIRYGRVALIDLDEEGQKNHPKYKERIMNNKPNSPEIDRQLSWNKMIEVKEEFLDGYSMVAKSHDSANAKAVQDVTEKLKSNPMVFHPNHYNANGIEVYDVIRAFGLSYELGNVIKYACRAYRKGEPIQDLEKAMFYLGLEIDRLKEATKNNTPIKPYENK